MSGPEKRHATHVTTFGRENESRRGQALGLYLKDLWTLGHVQVLRYV